MATETSMTIRWRTSSSVAGEVRYGTDPNLLDSLTAEAAATTEHQVTLSGLVPSTTYYYSVGSGGGVDAGGTPDHQFTASPPSNFTGSTRIWVLGDSGTANAEQLAVRNAYSIFSSSRPADLILLLGDNAYTNGTDSEYQAAFFNIYPSQLRRLPVWPTLGNHDTANSTDPAGNYPYFNIFTLPTNAESGGMASGKEHYYSFDRGNIHFVCLDSMTSNRSPAGPMAAWLTADLAANQKPWVIAFWHHPPYSKGTHNSDTELPLIEMRANILPILEAAGVDLTLSGHSHSYERSCLLDGHYGVSTTLTPAMKINPGDGRPNGSGAYVKPLVEPPGRNGAVHVVSGSSGWTQGGPLNHPVMISSLNQVGSLVIDIQGNRLDAAFIQPAGSPSGTSFIIGDSFTILKEAVSDTDRDGMPDDYEKSIGLDHKNPADAALDRDNDGITNLEEYQVSPQGVGGLSHRVLIQRNAENTVSRLVFYTAAGFKHRILSSEDLAGWTPASDWIAGDDTPHAWTDTALPAPTEDKRFFRVEIASDPP
jgi:hypothetical protein